MTKHRYQALTFDSNSHILYTGERNDNRMNSHKNTEMAVSVFFGADCHLIVVQPLANIVGDYIRSDRYDERNDNMLHSLTPFLLSDWAVTTAI